MALDQENYTTIQIDKRPNGVAVATLNRPERLNAVNGDMHHELAHICRDADADDEVKVLVFTGAGRAFCAGGDFSPGSETTHKITFEDALRNADSVNDIRLRIKLESDTARKTGIVEDHREFELEESEDDVAGGMI